MITFSIFQKNIKIGKPSSFFGKLNKKENERKGKCKMQVEFILIFRN